MSVVAETVLTYLPPKRKTTPSGWIVQRSRCRHNGRTADKRQRGGLISTQMEV